MCNMLQENCYVVSDETKECVIIDCGAFFEKDKSALTQYIADNELKPRRTGMWTITWEMPLCLPRIMACVLRCTKTMASC